MSWDLDMLLFVCVVVDVLCSALPQTPLFLSFPVLFVPRGMRGMVDDEVGPILFQCSLSCSWTVTPKIPFF